jgi:hypothetical protein
MHSRSVFLNLSGTTDPLQSLTNSADTFPKIILSHGSLQYNPWHNLKLDYLQIGNKLYEPLLQPK